MAKMKCLPFFLVWRAAWRAKPGKKEVWVDGRFTQGGGRCAPLPWVTIWLPLQGAEQRDLTMSVASWLLRDGTSRAPLEAVPRVDSRQNVTRAWGPLGLRCLTIEVTEHSEEFLEFELNTFAQGPGIELCVLGPQFSFGCLWDFGVGQ
jgi:hypothetical protein